MAHALLSPSSAVTWLTCVGAPALYKDMPEETSEYAEEGTRAHALAEQAAINEFTSDTEARADLIGDEEMVEAAVAWAQVLRTATAPGLLRGVLSGSMRRSWYAEQKVNIGHITGNTDDVGTCDFCAITHDGVLVVADFKYGRGVAVKCEENPQIMTYASAILRDRAIRSHIRHVRLVIFQPRLSSEPQVWETTVSHIDQFAYDAKKKAEQAMALVNGEALHEGDLVPGEAQCRFCKAKAVCPALRGVVQAETKADFEVVDPLPLAKADRPVLVVPETGEALAKALPWLESIEKWCDAVRAAAMGRLQAGDAVPGYKLVAGRKGPRKWTEGVEERMKAMRLRHDLIYVDKLVTPTQAEKAAKAGSIGPRQWKALQEFITQNDGAPSVVPEWDKRPALVGTKSDFDVVATQEPAPALETEDLFGADDVKAAPKAEQAAPVATDYTVEDLF